MFFGKKYRDALEENARLQTANTMLAGKVAQLEEQVAAFERDKAEHEHAVRAQVLGEALLAQQYSNLFNYNGTEQNQTPLPNADGGNA